MLTVLCRPAVRCDNDLPRPSKSTSHSSIYYTTVYHWSATPTVSLCIRQACSGARCYHPYGEVLLYDSDQQKSRGVWCIYIDTAWVSQNSSAYLEAVFIRAPATPSCLIGFIVCTDADKESSCPRLCKAEKPNFHDEADSVIALSPSRHAETAAAARSRSEAGQAKCSSSKALRIAGLPSPSTKLPVISAMLAR